ncbi:MAG: MbnP family protein [Bacteroidota bacterium]
MNLFDRGSYVSFLIGRNSNLQASIFFFLSFLFGLNPGLIAQESEGIIKFQPTWEGQALFLDSTVYLNKHQAGIDIETFKLYISDIEFLHKDQVVYRLKKKHHLLDLEKPESFSISLDNGPLIDADKIRFSLGIDSLTNVSGAFGGDLDPTNGMYWTWQSGYINLKIEGSSSLCPARHNRFQFHVGGYQQPFNSLRKLELAIADPEDIQVHIYLEQFIEAVDIQENYQVMSPNQQAIELANLISSIFSTAK